MQQEKIKQTDPDKKYRRVLAAVLPASPRIPEEVRAQRTEMPATGLRGAADSDRAS